MTPFAVIINPILTHGTWHMAYCAQLHGIGQSAVGHILWPSAVVLSEWMRKHPQVFQGRRRVLELGAGLGLCGLVAASLG